MNDFLLSDDTSDINSFNNNSNFYLLRINNLS